MPSVDRGSSSATAEGGAPIVYLPWVQHESEPGFDTEVAPSAHVARSGPHLQPLLEALQSETDESDRADALVLKKLARTGLSQREVEIELARELSFEQVHSSVDRYVRLGYIDDDRLADQIVRKQRSSKGVGSSGIRRELERRGIPIGVIERVMADFSNEDDLALATELAEGRLRRLAAEPSEVQQRRITSFLMRRGYNSDIARKAFDAARLAI